MTAISGDPDRLEHFSATTLPTLPPAHYDASSYGTALRALVHAPSTVNIGLSDFSAWIDSELSTLERVDHRPAAFAFALRQLDHFVAENPRDRTYLRTNDTELFDALVNARLSHPNSSDSDVYINAVSSLTGAPAQLAARFESAIDEINGAMHTDDVEAMQDRLRELLGSLQENNVYADPPLSDAAIVQQAWTILNGSDDGDIVPADAVHELEVLTGLLSRWRFDPAYCAGFYQSLGPRLTALLPQTISLAAWSDYQRTSGVPAFDMGGALISTDEALASASTNLSSSWRDDLFQHAAHGNALDDAIPLLFEYGQFSAPFAQSIGQLGLAVLHGTLTVDRGLGSPGYANFDHLATAWEERGLMLIATAARTPDAANALLRVPSNVDWLTDDDFGRTGGAARHAPDWDITAPSIRALIVSGTIGNQAQHPSLTREATANVINAAIDAGPGDASNALAPAYGEMVQSYLPDFARSPGMDLAAVNVNGYVSVGAMQAAQFTSLAMRDDASRRAIFSLRDALDLQTVVVGLDPANHLYPPWPQRLANIDGIVLSGANGEVFVNAREQDAEAERYNSNLDLFQSIGMNVIGLAAFPGSGVVDQVIEKGFDQLKDHVLYEDTNNAEHAGYTTNVAAFSALDHERLVVAEGQLIVDVRAEQSGAALSADQAEFIQHAEQMLGAPYVDSLRAAANGAISAPSAIDARQLQEWAGTAPLDAGFTDASSYMSWILPRDGSSLWSH